MNIEALKHQYEYICNEYVNKFCRKQGVQFNGFVGNIVGGVCCVSDYYINFSDIVYDLNTSQPKRLIFDWNNEMIDAHSDGKDTINYFRYSKGLRIEGVEKAIDYVKEVTGKTNIDTINLFQNKF